MFNLRQKKSELQQMLDNYAVELAMFMRWCETCGSGPLSPVRCVEVAQSILIRERFDTPSYESLYVASVAASSPKSEVDKMRIITGFDGVVKGFCESIGIELPYRKALPKKVPPASAPVPRAYLTKRQTDPRDHLPIDDDLNLAFSRLKEAEYFRSELQYQVQFLLPVLSDELAAKTGYACAVKLLAARSGGYSRVQWEESIVNMLLASDESFDPDSALHICRRVEKSLADWCAPFTSPCAVRTDAHAMTNIPAPLKQTDTVYVNAGLAGVTWLLKRTDDEHAISGGLLTLLLAVGAEHGWRVAGLTTSNPDGMVTISLGPYRVAGHEATKLRDILLSAMSNLPSDQADEAARAVQEFLKFLRGGGFNLQRQR